MAAHHLSNHRTWTILATSNHSGVTRVAAHSLFSHGNGTALATWNNGGVTRENRNSRPTQQRRQDRISNTRYKRRVLETTNREPGQLSTNLNAISRSSPKITCQRRKNFRPSPFTKSCLFVISITGCAMSPSLSTTSVIRASDEIWNHVVHCLL